MSQAPIGDFAALRGPTRPAVTQPPPQFDADYPAPQSRLLILFRYPAALPQLIVVTALAYAVALTTVLAWFAILFSGAFPRALFDFGALYLRWWARVQAYLFLLSDRYPPLGDGPYPAQFVIQYPERSSRAKTFFRAILAIPSALVFWLLSYVALAVLVLAWIALLCTRRYPLGLFLFTLGWIRWELRLQAYLLLLTDHYPPFQLSETAAPAEPYLSGPVSSMETAL